MPLSSSEGPLVVVLGATGAQGGSVIKHLAQLSGPIRVRAVTRDASKPKSQMLKSVGVEVVEGDISNRESLDKAFAGADVVFAVTDFWAHQDAQREINDGKRIVDAVKDAKATALIWSGLEPVSKISGGKLRQVEHFDSKATVTDYAREKLDIVSNVACGCYMSNFLPGSQLGFKLAPSGDGYELALPVKETTKVSLIDTPNDYGAFVRALLEPQANTLSTDVFACTEELTLKQMVNQVEEATGVPTVYRQLAPAEYLQQFGKQKEKLATELLEMLQWFEEYGYFAGKDVQPSLTAVQQLNIPLKSWKQFVAERFLPHGDGDKAKQ
ncbi:hypothetical protein JCM8097_002840 [Rhodosporidiobolus ruineniae]